MLSEPPEASSSVCHKALALQPLPPGLAVALGPVQGGHAGMLSGWAEAGVTEAHLRALSAVGQGFGREESGAHLCSSSQSHGAGGSHSQHGGTQGHAAAQSLQCGPCKMQGRASHPPALGTAWFIFVLNHLFILKDLFERGERERVFAPTSFPIQMAAWPGLDQAAARSFIQISHRVWSPGTWHDCCCFSRHLSREPDRKQSNQSVNWQFTSSQPQASLKGHHMLALWHMGEDAIPYGHQQFYL